MASSLLPATGTPEWSVWKRGASGNTLSSLTQGAYLVKCSESPADSVPLMMQVRLPASTWVTTGANFLGFPGGVDAAGKPVPLFSKYFESFPQAIAPGTSIDQYVGGDLGPANPKSVFPRTAANADTADVVDYRQAYWFSAETAGMFSGPLEVSLASGEVMDFGRNKSVIIMRLRNHTNGLMKVNLIPTSSAKSGESQVPLTIGAVDSSSGAWIYSALSSATPAQEVPSSGSVELRIGIDRAKMTSSINAAVYASSLRLQDTSNLCDIWVPVRAQVTALSGLWMGEALVNAVESKPQFDSAAKRSPVKPVSRPFPLRWLLHQDSTGKVRLLSQVFVGRLAAGGAFAGLCTRENLLLSSDLKNARRLSVAHLPLDTEVNGSGTIADTVTATITLSADNTTNPFVHRYHPDHPVPTANDPPGKRYAYARKVSFQFTKDPPPGSGITASEPGWGSTLVGGRYTEFIQGIHKDSPLSSPDGAIPESEKDGLEVSGTFLLRRVTEISDISTPSAK